MKITNNFILLLVVFVSMVMAAKERRTQVKRYSSEEGTWKYNDSNEKWVWVRDTNETNTENDLIDMENEIVTAQATVRNNNFFFGSVLTEDRMQGRDGAEAYGTVPILDAQLQNSQITANQPWGNPKIGHGVNNGVHRFIVRAGRKKSKAVANGFMEGLEHRNVMPVDGKGGNRPDELNFFVNVDITLSDKGFMSGVLGPVIFKNLRLAQGSHGLTNNWWIGSPNCWSTAYPQLKCTPDSHPNMEVTFTTEKSNRIVVSGIKFTRSVDTGIGMNLKNEEEDVVAKATVRTNDVKFFSVMAGTTQIKELVLLNKDISNSQPWGNPDVRVLQGLQGDGNKHTIRVLAGRKKTTRVANNFMKGIYGKNVINTGSGGNSPNKLNFFIEADITFAEAGIIQGLGDMTFKNMRIGQGSGYTITGFPQKINNWWLGGENCESTQTNVLKCFPSSHPHLAVNFREHGINGFIIDSVVSS